MFFFFFFFFFFLGGNGKIRISRLLVAQYSERRCFFLYTVPSNLVSCKFVYSIRCWKKKSCDEFFTRPFRWDCITFERMHRRYASVCKICVELSTQYNFRTNLIKFVHDKTNLERINKWLRLERKLRVAGI